MHASFSFLLDTPNKATLVQGEALYGAHRCADVRCDVQIIYRCASKNGLPTGYMTLFPAVGFITLTTGRATSWKISGEAAVTALRGRRFHVGIVRMKNEYL